MKLTLIILTLSILVTAAGCSADIQHSEGAAQDSGETGEEEIQWCNPPSIQVTAGEERIETLKGSQKWKVEHDNGEISYSEADTAPPSTVPEFKYPQNVSSDAEVTVEFPAPPISYQIFEWDEEDNVIDRFDDLSLAGQEGLKIYEIRARWDQGIVSYVMYLDVR
jgi:hypothetical protein